MAGHKFKRNPTTSSRQPAFSSSCSFFAVIFTVGRRFSASSASASTVLIHTITPLFLCCLGLFLPGSPRNLIPRHRYCKASHISDTQST